MDAIGRASKAICSPKKINTYKYLHVFNGMSIKCIFIGDSGSGKSSILAQGLHNCYNRQCNPTIGVDFKIYHSSEAIVNIWDTSGDPAFHSLVRMFEKPCNCVVYVFAANDPESFNNIIDWHTELYSQDKSYFCICNKIDLASADSFRTRINHLFPSIVFLESSRGLEKNGENILQKIVSLSTKVDTARIISRSTECCVIL